MESAWNDIVTLPEFEKLNGDKNTDVLIIGGGIAGILCAYFLEQNNIKYILVEGNKICSGVTKNTTAKITSQHNLIYNKMLNSKGIEKTKMYLDINEQAVKKYIELSKDIDCDFEIKDNYVYSVDDAKKLEDEIRALEKVGFSAELSSKINLPFKTQGAVKFLNQAQFNPLKFIAGICKNLKIFENTYVKEIKENIAVTDNGNIKAGKIIVATHFPFINRRGSYFLKQYQHRSYVIALENAENINGMYIDENKKGLSFRNYENMLLLGGGSHRTGKTFDKSKVGDWEVLREAAKTYYPKANEKYFWATQDCMSLDNIPYIGNYSMNTPDLFVATGFNKWGMTSSMAAAMILTDLVLDKKNDYAMVFNPSRSMLKPQLLINGFEAVTHLLTISPKRCTHMGCALKWNKSEHTWDCPCHGSRYTSDGKVINNPAMKNMKKV